MIELPRATRRRHPAHARTLIGEYVLHRVPILARALARPCVAPGALSGLAGRIRLDTARLRWRLLWSTQRAQGEPKPSPAPVSVSVSARPTSARATHAKKTSDRVKGEEGPGLSDRGELASVGPTLGCRCTARGRKPHSSAQIPRPTPARRARRSSSSKSYNALTLSAHHGHPIEAPAHSPASRCGARAAVPTAAHDASVSPAC